MITDNGKSAVILGLLLLHGLADLVVAVYGARDISPAVLESLAAAYERYFNRISRHHHCDGPEVWQQRLEAAGLRLESSFPYFSARATHALDLGHYLGMPSLVAKKLLGRWILAPNRWNLALTERWLRPLYEEPLPETGAYVFFVAQSL